MYGPDSRRPGTYAVNCLLARRLAERNVRFIQLHHHGWDQHNGLPRDLALAVERGLLDSTLVVWGGEFGRTVYCQDQGRYFRLTDVHGNPWESCRRSTLKRSWNAWSWPLRRGCERLRKPPGSGFGQRPP